MPHFSAVTDCPRETPQRGKCVGHRWPRGPSGVGTDFRYCALTHVVPMAVFGRPNPIDLCPLTRVRHGNNDTDDSAD